MNSFLLHCLLLNLIYTRLSNVDPFQLLPCSISVLPFTPGCPYNARARSVSPPCLLWLFSRTSSITRTSVSFRIPSPGRYSSLLAPSMMMGYWENASPFFRNVPEPVVLSVFISSSRIEPGRGFVGRFEDPYLPEKPLDICDMYDPRMGDS